MTKQEVYNNIQYNKNLVRQYTIQIADLERQISSINSALNNYNSENSQMQSKLKKAKSDVDELNRLYSKVESLQENFMKKQTLRKKNLVKNFIKVPSVWFIKSYISGMTGLLSGAEYRNVFNGLAYALTQIKGRTHTGYNEIERLNAECHAIMTKIASSQQNINTCRIKVKDINSQISYRRRRIVYWEDQLQYAT